MSTPSVTTSSNLVYPPDRDGRVPHKVSTSEFLITSGLLLPLWATVLLPLSVSYQALKFVKEKIIPSPQIPPPSPVDSGYQVPSDDVMPMIPRPQRKYDLVVLGATGFTGKLAVRHLAKTYGVNNSNKSSMQWAIAGRSQSKLEAVKESLAKELKMPELLNVDIIIADTSVPSTMPSLVKDTRAVISTAGPFSQYSNSVVEFCAKFGTHFADITGEVSWVKDMMTRWQDTAQQSGAKIVSFCGHDCVPWDLTVNALSQKLKEEKGEDLVHVTCMDEGIGEPSGGTIATTFLSIDGKLPATPTPDPFEKTANGALHNKRTHNQLKFLVSKTIKPWNGQTAYTSPFVMAPINLEVVRWSQALRGAKSDLSYSEFQVEPDFKGAFVHMVQLAVLVTALLNPITSSLLQKVLPKPGEGPSMKAMVHKHYLSVYARGIGNGGSEAQAVMYLPRDAGYLDTARMLVESGLSLALEESNLPYQRGGFVSPAFGLGNVLLKRLTDTGTHFECRIKESSKNK